jgi:hypothetical protein
MRNVAGYKLGYYHPRKAKDDEINVSMFLPADNTLRQVIRESCKCKSTNKDNEITNLSRSTFIRIRGMNFVGLWHLFYNYYVFPTDAKAELRLKQTCTASLHMGCYGLFQTVDILIVTKRVSLPHNIKFIQSLKRFITLT